MESTIEKLVRAILGLEAVNARRNGDKVKSCPGEAAAEGAIGHTEDVRGGTFAPAYRAFLALHDGWKHFAWGTWLLSTDELADDSFYEGVGECLADMAKDGDVPDALAGATVIGASEDDATLVLLLSSGEVVDWLYEETGRAPDFIAYLEQRREALDRAKERAEQTRARVRADWSDSVRELRQVERPVELRDVLAIAPAPSEPSRLPEAHDPLPPAVTLRDLVLVNPTGKVLASVHLTLVLYLHAYPSPAEVRATYRAFRRHFAVAGCLEWRPAHAHGFATNKQDDPDDIGFVEQIEPDDFGYFGLRASIGAHDTPRRTYVLNVRGLPPAMGDTRPRAGFCEVMIPADESAPTLHALALELLDALPVVAGHGGFAAYGGREDAANEQIFAWCRRFFGVDVGLIDGWLPGAVTRLRGASWLTVLGSAFATALEEAGRLSFPASIAVTRGANGVLAAPRSWRQHHLRGKRRRTLSWI